MNDYNENYLSMSQKVQGYLSLHSADTAGIVAVATLKTQLDGLVNAILATASRVNTDNSGYTVDKQVKRDDLKAKTLKISGALVAYSAMTPGYKTSAKIDETPNAIDLMRDNDVYTYSRLVVSEATPVMASLTPFGVAAADLTALNTSATAYLANIQSPRVQIAERSKAGDELETQFDALATFLKDKLDAVMGVYISSNPSLYEGYLSARSIDDTSGAGTPDYQGNINVDSFVLLADLPYLASRGFTFRNTGTVSLTFALSQNPNTLEGTPVIVGAGTSNTRQTANLNPNSLATKLYVRNADLTAGGSYKVFIQE